MSDTQDNEAYLAQLRNRKAEMPLSRILEEITKVYLRQEEKVLKLQREQRRLETNFKPGNDDEAPLSQDQLAEQDRIAALKDLDKHYAKNRKEIEQMRETAKGFREKAEKTKGPLRGYFNMRAHLFEARATNAEQLLDRMMDPMSETRQKATEYRAIVADLQAKAEAAKDKFERETDPKEKRKLAREAMSAAMHAARMKRDLDQLETPDRQIGLDKISNRTQNAVQDRQRERKQATITTGNIQRDLEVEMPKLKKLESLLGDAFILERNGVENIDVRMLSKRDFAHMAEAVSEAAAAMPADSLPSEQDVPLKEQVEIMNRQYDFARKHARGLMGDFLWMFEQAVTGLSESAEGRKLLADIMPPMKKDQIVADAEKLYGADDKPKQAKRKPAPASMKP